ncbi:MAG: hypothetical protein KKE11_00130 [Gammaproteobacteria bacterium]|nr:hypothetical protein [Gammaproteobacteria bacterium]
MKTLNQEQIANVFGGGKCMCEQTGHQQDAYNEDHCKYICCMYINDSAYIFLHPGLLGRTYDTCAETEWMDVDGEDVL